MASILPSIYEIVNLFYLLCIQLFNSKQQLRSALVEAFQARCLYRHLTDNAPGHADKVFAGHLEAENLNTLLQVPSTVDISCCKK